MNFGSKWSELSAEDKQKAKDQYGSKQSWQDAKARSQGYANEQERRGNSGERQAANNPSPSTPQEPTYTAPGAPSAPTPTPTPTPTASAAPNPTPTHTPPKPVSYTHLTLPTILLV